MPTGVKLAGKHLLAGLYASQLLLKEDFFVAVLNNLKICNL